jgi:hypothetical protein
LKKINITEKVGEDFKLRLYEKANISKIDENKIICVYRKFNENKTFFIIIKIPEFIFGHKNKENSIFDFIIYKNYILFYTWDKKIKIYENSKCKLVQEINVKGFFSMIHLKDNYLLGSMTEYAVENVIKHYKEIANYNCPIEQAQDEAFAIINAYERNARDWEELYSVPIMNTPFEVDKKLLWICRRLKLISVMIMNVIKLALFVVIKSKHFQTVSLKY